MKHLIFCIFLFINLFPTIVFTDNHKIDYSEIEKKEWNNLKKIKIDTEIRNISKKIRSEEIKNKNISVKKLFPETEIWVLKKYDITNLYETKLVNGFPCIYTGNEMIFPSVNALSLSNNKYIGIVFNDYYKNIITVGSTYSIYVYKQKEKRLKIILWMKGENNEYYTSRLLEAKNVLLFIASWVNENIHGVPEYSYIKLYKYNLLKKEVEIFDSYDYGIVSNGVDEVEGFFPVYDISHDQRYVYIPARGDREYIRNKLFNREKMKMSGGLYVFDWWQNKIYKLFEGNVVAVTNNTEDGFVYIKTMKYENNHRINEYFRFKNPEEMLDEIKN